MSVKTKILIVEDEVEIRKLIRGILLADNMSPLEALNAKEAKSQIIGAGPDLIILDLGLPDMDGQKLILELREWCQIPIIVISARESEREIVSALENGADDYLTKPFSTAELIVRIKVALRNNSKSDKKYTTFESNGLKIDFAARAVTLNAQEVKLTPIEYKLLCLFAQNIGKVLTHQQIMAAVWGKRSNDKNNYLRIHTQHLREKLFDDPLKPTFIITIPSIGYKLKNE